MVGLLILSGLSCLAMSAAGLLWQTEATWQSLIMRTFAAIMPYLMWLLGALCIWILGSYLFHLLRPAPRALHCPTCQHTVEPTWRRCPYCESALTQQEESAR